MTTNLLPRNMTPPGDIHLLKKIPPQLQAHAIGVTATKQHVLKDSMHDMCKNVYGVQKSQVCCPQKRANR